MTTDVPLHGCRTQARRVQPPAHEGFLTLKALRTVRVARKEDELGGEGC